MVSYSYPTARASKAPRPTTPTLPSLASAAPTAAARLAQAVPPPQVFSALDVNQDAQLDWAEYKGGVLTLVKEKMPQAILLKLGMSEMDAIQKAPPKLHRYFKRCASGSECERHCARILR